jgi:hypothetical protein
MLHALTADAVPSSRTTARGTTWDAGQGQNCPVVCSELRSIADNRCGSVELPLLLPLGLGSSSSSSLLDSSSRLHNLLDSSCCSLVDSSSRWSSSISNRSSSKPVQVSSYRTSCISSSTISSTIGALLRRVAGTATASAVLRLRKGHRLPRGRHLVLREWHLPRVASSIYVTKKQKRPPPPPVPPPPPPPARHFDFVFFVRGRRLAKSTMTLQQRSCGVHHLVVFMFP